MALDETVLDLAGAMAGDVFDRDYEAITTSSIDVGVVGVSVNGLVGDDLIALLPQVQGLIAGQIYSLLQEALASVDEDLLLVLASGPAPVSVVIDP